MNVQSTTLRVFLLLSVLVSLAGAASAEPDEQVLGKGQGYPVATSSSNWQETLYRVGSWSALDKVPGLLTSPVIRASAPIALPNAAQVPVIGYRYRNIAYTLDEYLGRNRVTGLLILKNGEIVAERYRYARTEDARFFPWRRASPLCW
jgi:hypothetical protein